MVVLSFGGEFSWFLKLHAFYWLADISVDYQHVPQGAWGLETSLTFC